VSAVPDGVFAAVEYPTGRAERDRFVLARRGSRHAVDPWATPRVAIDPEPDGAGGVVDAVTLFLTGRECPWRCVMCDLWRDTLETDTPPGAIPHQIAAGLRLVPSNARRHVKLYNAGSFFDDRAVPPADDAAIAQVVAAVSRLTVESHPRLVGDRTWHFRDRLPASLDVAMGLETAHPDALARLNKGCTLDDFATAARALVAHGVGLRVFLLVHPPFVPQTEQMPWLLRSIDAAIEAGASTIALIPTRGETGAMPALAAAGLFAPPSLSALEDAAAEAIRHAAGRARILADLWDLAAFAACAACLAARQARLLRLNLEQRVPAPTACACCVARGQEPG